MGVCIFVIAALAIILPSINARIYDEGSLTDELRNFGVPEDQIATFVCIARYESSFNTAAVNNINDDQSHDYGLFQINDRYWCEHGSPGKGCGVRCEDLTNDDIADDVRCAQHIQQVQGFPAWTVYAQHCR